MWALLNSHASVFYLVALVVVSVAVAITRRDPEFMVWGIGGCWAWYFIANGITFIVDHVMWLCGCEEVQRAGRILGTQLGSVTTGWAYYAMTLIFPGPLFFRYFYCMVGVFTCCSLVWLFEWPLVWQVYVQNGLFIVMLWSLWQSRDEEYARSD